MYSTPEMIFAAPLEGFRNKKEIRRREKEKNPGGWQVGAPASLFLGVRIGRYAVHRTDGPLTDFGIGAGGGG
jgi:hypothetical protein